MALRTNDYTLGSGIILISLTTIYYAIPEFVISPGSVHSIVLTPKFWPNVIAWMMFVIGISIVIRHRLWGVKHADKKTTTPSQAYLFRLLMFAIFMGAYYLLLPILGMVWTSSLAFIVFSLLIAESRYRISSIIVGISLPIALYAFFYHGAGVDIPQSEFMRLP